MAATKLNSVAVPKPWGRHDLAPWSEAREDAVIGEMIYDGGDDAPLLIKALFTSERLSVQVHPDDDAARELGLPRGKDEAWIILAAEPGATIGLGLRHAVSRAELAAAARDGSIEQLVDWLPASAGDVFYAPAGTIHAIGAGLTLIEVQQNLDLTYRLFDYGRPRDLHLDDGIAAAAPEPWSRQAPSRALGEGRRSLIEGPRFVVERVLVSGGAWLEPPVGRATWLAILAGSGRIDGLPCGSGEVWLAEMRAHVEFDGDGEVLLAYPGAGIAPGVWASARRQAA
jgi:mannose-6-phosphate isomerase